MLDGIDLRPYQNHSVALIVDWYKCLAASHRRGSIPFGADSSVLVSLLIGYCSHACFDRHFCVPSVPTLVTWFIRNMFWTLACFVTLTLDIFLDILIRPGMMHLPFRHGWVNLAFLPSYVVSYLMST